MKSGWSKKGQIGHFLAKAICGLTCSHLPAASHLAADRLGHFPGADGRGVVAIGLHVVGHVAAFGDHGGDGPLQPLGGVLFLEMPQHQGPGENQGRGIDLVQPLIFRGTAVGGLENGPVGADIRPRGDPQSAHQAGGQVAEDVAVQVGQHEHVV